MRKLLTGELNPFIASMRRQARLTGDRGFGTRVALGLQAGSPFVADADKGEHDMSLDTVSILDGSTFVVSDRRGDLDASPTDNHGLFLEDTRFLSRWILTVCGIRPKTLSVDDRPTSRFSSSRR